MVTWNLHVCKLYSYLFVFDKHGGFIIKDYSGFQIIIVILSLL